MIPCDVMIPRNLDMEAEWSDLLADVAREGYGTTSGEVARDRLAERLARLELTLAELWRAHPRLQDQLLGEVDR